MKKYLTILFLILTCYSVLSIDYSTDPNVYIHYHIDVGGSLEAGAGINTYNFTNPSLDMKSGNTFFTCEIEIGVGAKVDASGGSISIGNSVPGPGAPEDTIRGFHCGAAGVWRYYDGSWKTFGSCDVGRYYLKFVGDNSSDNNWSLHSSGDRGQTWTVIDDDKKIGQTQNGFRLGYEALTIENDTGTTFNVGSYFCYNGTTRPLEAAAPPEITQATYDVTSAVNEDNATIWRTATTLACKTIDRTPSLTFDTNENARCATSTNDLTYTQMVTSDATTNCSSTVSTSHTCTLPVTQQLNISLQNLFVGCKGENGQEAASSSSGPLAIELNINMTGNVTGPENNAVDDATIVVNHLTNNTCYDSTTTESTGLWFILVAKKDNYTAYAYNSSTNRANISHYIEVR